MATRSTTCLLPLGQQRVGAAQMKAHKLAFDKAWPETLMSFEVWCAVTRYDPEQGVTGGEPFQVLMNTNLGGAAKEHESGVDEKGILQP